MTAEEAALLKADQNAEALAKSQGNPFSNEIDPAREAELDEAFAKISAEPQPTDTAEFGRGNNGVQPPIEGAPKTGEKEEAARVADEEKAAAEAAAALKPVEPAVEPAKEPAKKGLLDDLIAEPTKPAVETKPADPFAEVKLRSDASPKTRETFEQLKTVAKQREDAAIARAVAAETARAELEAKTKELEARTVAPEVEAELKELRSFRAQFDTANDPEFRAKYDARLNQNYTAVYTKLQAHGLPTSEIEKLKGFSQQDRDNAIDGFLSKLPSGDRKFIEAKLLDNINVADERERALQEARGKADEILSSRKSAPVQQAQQRINEIAALVQPELSRLPFIHVKEIPANTAPEERKRIEAENTTALALQEQLKTAITDDSPVTRARAALSVPLARHYSGLYASEKARADALQKKLDGITAASTTSRTARSIASPVAPAPKPTEHVDAADAIDSLFAEVSQTR